MANFEVKLDQERQNDYNTGSMGQSPFDVFQLDIVNYDRLI